MRASCAEGGCLGYVFAANPIEPGRVVLFESWESADALAAHAGARAATPAIPAGAPPPVQVRSSAITRYEISGSGPLS